MTFIQVLPPPMPPPPPPGLPIDADLILLLLIGLLYGVFLLKTQAKKNSLKVILEPEKTDIKTSITRKKTN